MIDDNDFPRTLQQAIQYFADESVCIHFIANMRWENGIAVCPACKGTETSFLKTRSVWKCKNKACKKQFSVKVGTILEGSNIGLDKWICAVWMITNAKNGVSSYEIHRAIGVTQKTAWFMLHRIRVGMQAGTIEKLSGTVECDETFVGGKSKNMHKARREQIIDGKGVVGKAIVMGILEREGNVRAQVVKGTDRPTLHGVIQENIEHGSNIHTDEWRSYRGLSQDYIHEIVNHSVEYVRGNVHTNGIENFWSLFKRTINGTYISVRHEHLPKYLDEQVFRFNERKKNDSDRFQKVVGMFKGKRLKYKQLIGKE